VKDSFSEKFDQSIFIFPDYREIEMFRNMSGSFLSLLKFLKRVDVGIEKVSGYIDSLPSDNR